LTVVDNYSRECLAIEGGKRVKGEDVVEVMNRVRAERGVPRSIHVDNGPEFSLPRKDEGAGQVGVSERG